MDDKTEPTATVTSVPPSPAAPRSPARPKQQPPPSPKSPLSSSKPSPMSFAERKARGSATTTAAATTTTTTTIAAKVGPAKPKPPPLVEGGDLMRDIERPPPGDVTLPPYSARSANAKSPIPAGAAGQGTTAAAAADALARRPDLATKRSAYFQDVFAARGAGLGDGLESARERVRAEAMVLAEVKTNVIIADELRFITQLSQHLAHRYSRPTSCVCVSVTHGALMLFGGTFEPCYYLTVTALPGELQPATNKRNAAVVQRHMEENLGVAAVRGVVRFVPAPEDNWARDGRTVSGELIDVDRERQAGGGVAAADEDGERLASPPLRSARKRLSVKSFSSFKASLATPPPQPSELTPPASAGEAPLISGLPPIPASPHGQNHPDNSSSNRRPEKVARRTKSFVATFFNRGGGTTQRSESSHGLIPE